MTKKEELARIQDEVSQIKDELRLRAGPLGGALIGSRHTVDVGPERTFTRIRPRIAIHILQSEFGLTDDDLATRGAMETDVPRAQTIRLIRIAEHLVAEEDE